MSVQVVQRVQVPSSSPDTGHYIQNRAPLQPVPFQKLPPGAVQPSGWLLAQLKVQLNGLNGRLSEISDYLITSKVFLGFDTARVKKILGEPNQKISLKNKWVYNISYCNQDISLVFHWLTIHFDNKYHVSVVEHESRQD